MGPRYRVPYAVEQFGRHGASYDRKPERDDVREVRRDAANVEGHEHGKIRYFVYNGGAQKFVAKITEIADNNYEGVDFR